jgi:hypothetical protein
MQYIFALFLVCSVHSIILTTPTDVLSQSLLKLQTDRNLKGIQLEVTKNYQPIYNFNTGFKNEKNESIDG